MEAAVVSGAAAGAHGSDVALWPEAGGEQAPAGGEPAGAGPVPFRLQICRPAGQWHRPAAGPELLLLPDGRLRHRRIPWPHGAGGVSGILRRRGPDVPQAPLRPSHGPGGAESADVPPHLHPAGAGCGPAGLHHRSFHEGAAGQPDRRPVASGQDHRLRERLHPYGVAGPCGLLPTAVSGLLRLFLDGHRRGRAAGLPAAPELRAPLCRPLHAGLLAPLAHQSQLLVPGLCVYPAGRQQKGGGPVPT